MQGIWIEMGERHRIATADPVARHVKELRDRHQGQYSLQLKVHRFVNLEAEEAYIYPAVNVPGRKTRVFAIREEFAEGHMKDVKEEIGVIPARPGDDAFNKGWIEFDE